jgi:hypothetical protein
VNFPDTEEVTSSNPVRPTRHFLFLALPGTLRGPITGPRARAEEMPRSQAHGHHRGRPQAQMLPCRRARERFRDQVALKFLLKNSPWTGRANGLERLTAVT